MGLCSSCDIDICDKDICEDDNCHYNTSNCQATRNISDHHQLLYSNNGQGNLYRYGYSRALLFDNNKNNEPPYNPEWMEHQRVN